jgi:Flp pilus assembly protein TadG
MAPTKTKCSRGRRRSQSGVALVEFALVLPVLMLILVGVVDFGKAINYWIDETHLASEAARYAAVSGNPGSGTLAAYIQGQADTAELRSGSARVSKMSVCITTPAGTAVGSPVTATVTTNYSWIPLLGNRIGTASSNITVTATMRLETPPAANIVGCS